jgi:hypothetical protein
MGAESVWAAANSRFSCALPVLGRTLHDPLGGPIVHPRCLGGSNEAQITIVTAAGGQRAGLLVLSDAATARQLARCLFAAADECDQLS